MPPVESMFVTRRAVRGCLSCVAARRAREVA